MPFLKNKDDGVGAGPVETKHRKPDEGEDMDMLSAVAQDMLSAFEKKDKALLKEALAALVEHIQEEDEEMDEKLLGDK